MLKVMLQYFGHLIWRAASLEKTLMPGKDWQQEEKGVTEEEMVGWHHWLNDHEFEQTPGDGEGQGSWCAAVHGVAESWTRLSNWTTIQIEGHKHSARGTSVCSIINKAGNTLQHFKRVQHWHVLAGKYLHNVLCSEGSNLQSVNTKWYR